MSLSPSRFDNKILSLNVAQFAKAIPECSDASWECRRGSGTYESDAIDLMSLLVRSDPKQLRTSTRRTKANSLRRLRSS